MAFWDKWFEDGRFLENYGVAIAAGGIVLVMQSLGLGNLTAGFLLIVASIPIFAWCGYSYRKGNQAKEEHTRLVEKHRSKSSKSKRKE